MKYLEKGVGDNWTAVCNVTITRTVDLTIHEKLLSELFHSREMSKYSGNPLVKVFCIQSIAHRGGLN